MTKYNSESCGRTPAANEFALSLSLRDANPDAAHLLYGRPSAAGRTVGRVQSKTSLRYRSAK
jgi:hypothetical protein